MPGTLFRISFRFHYNIWRSVLARLDGWRKSLDSLTDLPKCLDHDQSNRFQLTSFRFCLSWYTFVPLLGNSTRGSLLWNIRQICTRKIQKAEIDWKATRNLQLWQAPLSPYPVDRTKNDSMGAQELKMRQKLEHNQLRKRELGTMGKQITLQNLQIHTTHNRY